MEIRVEITDSYEIVCGLFCLSSVEIRVEIQVEILVDFFCTENQAKTNPCRNPQKFPRGPENLKSTQAFAKIHPEIH